MAEPIEDGGGASVRLACALPKLGSPVGARVGSCRGQSLSWRPDRAGGVGETYRVWVE